MGPKRGRKQTVATDLRTYGFRDLVIEGKGTMSWRFSGGSRWTAFLDAAHGIFYYKR